MGWGALGKRGTEVIREARWDAEHLNFKCGVPLHACVRVALLEAVGRVG